jgi:hypothetical protein
MMTKMMANQSFDSVHTLYGCSVRLFVLKTSKQLPNEACKQNLKKQKHDLKQLKKHHSKKHVFLHF